MAAATVWLLPPDAGPVEGQESGGKESTVAPDDEVPCYWPYYCTPTPTPADTPTPITPSTPTDTPGTDPPTAIPTPVPSGSLSASPSSISLLNSTTVRVRDVTPSNLSLKIEYPSPAMGWPDCGDDASNVAPTGTETTPSFTGNTSFVFMGCAPGTHTLRLLTKVGSKELATVSIGVDMPPTPTNTPVTPEPTPVPVSVYANISRSDDDVSVVYGWRSGGEPKTDSSSSWTITLRRSATQNGTYTYYRSTTRQSAVTVSFNSVSKGYWFKARVSACDEQSNCASTDSNQLWVPPDTPDPPTSTPTPSGKLTATPTTIERFSTTKVTATDLSPSSVYFRIEYPDTLQLGTNCSTRGTGKRYTTRFKTTTNFTFSGCKYGVHTLRLLTETGTKALATASITVATPTPTPNPPTFGSNTIPDQLLHVRRTVNLTLPAAQGGSGILQYTIDPPLGNGLSFVSSTRKVVGTPNSAVITTTHTYKATDDRGTATTIDFDVAVFDVAVTVRESGLHAHKLGDLSWRVLSYGTTAIHEQNSRNQDYQFRLRIPASAGFQLNRQECTWPTESPTSKSQLWSPWVGQGSVTPFAFPVVRCGIGSGATLTVDLWVRLGNVGVPLLLNTKQVAIPQSPHQHDHLIPYHVRGTYTDTNNQRRIRGVDESGKTGMFPPYPQTGDYPIDVDPSPVLFVLSAYSDAAEDWNVVTQGADRKVKIEERSSSVAEMTIVGYWAKEVGSPKNECTGTIACANETGMWLEEPPFWPGRNVKEWTNNWTWANDKPEKYQYLPAILAHEFGHPLGLGNAAGRASIMTADALEYPCAADILACLTYTDRSALKAIYLQHEPHK